MSFKGLKTWMSGAVGATLLLSSVVSCSYFFDDKDTTNSKTYELSINEKAGLDCVSQNTDLLRDYFNMKREDAQIRRDLLEMRTCLQDAVNLFVRYVDGSQVDGGYNAMEIHRFLGDNFSDYTYPLEFMEEAFRLKDSMLGGTAFSVSKKEVAVLMEYLDFIYENLALMSSDRHHLFSDKPSMDTVGYRRSAAVLMRVLRAFNQLPRKSEGQFNYDSVTRLITYFLDDGDSEEWQRNFQVVNGLQSLLVAGQKDVMDIRKLSFAVEHLGQLYISFRQFENFLKGNERDGKFYNDISSIFTFPGLLNAVIKNPEVFAPEKLEVLNEIQYRTLGSIRAAVEAAPNSQLSTRYVNDLLDIFDSLEMLPSYASGGTLKGLVPQFFGRWLSSHECLEPEDVHRTPSGTLPLCESTVVTVDNVDLLIRHIREWAERQKWVNSQSPRRDRQQIDIRRNDRASANLQAFQDSLLRLNHLHWEEYVVIGSKEVTYKDLVILNNIYTLVSIFTRPFNKNWEKPFLDYYLSQSQTQQLFEWIRDLGVELKIIDPRSLNSGMTAFAEINLFGSTSYNAEELNFTEMIEYLEISISTGLRSVFWMEHEFQECNIGNLLDVFDLVKKDMNCFRPSWSREIYRHLFVSLPLLWKELEEGQFARLPDVLSQLEKASRQGMIADAPAETDTFRMMSSISQYAEALFLRFDTNGDNFIDSKELPSVLAHISPSIRKIINESLDQATAGSLYGIFPEFEANLVTYIIDKKRLPGLMVNDVNPGTLLDVADLMAFRQWQNLMPDWLKGEVRVLREDFLLVISGLSYFNRLQKIKKLKNIFWENDFRFDQGIKDINDPIFTSIINELSCSSRVVPQLRQWLFDNQSVYWIKAQVEAVNIFGVNIPFTQNFSNWQEAVTFKVIDSVFREPNIGHLCNLPYTNGSHRIRVDQEIKKVQRRCELELAFWNGFTCVENADYQLY